MTEFSNAEERDLLAAEHALGLLEGQALIEAQRLEREDPAFAAAVAAWSERLAPLLDEVAPVEPRPELWRRIERAIGPSAPANDNEAGLRRKLRLWRAYAAGATAIAASLALMVGYEAAREQPPVAVQPQAAPMMVATLSSPEAPTLLSIAYDPQRSSLLVTPGQMSGAAGHDHELWIIPPGGQPVSLGLVRSGAPQRIAVPASLAPHFRLRAGMALSVEPVGGSPTGQPTGPVVASGELLTV